MGLQQAQAIGSTQTTLDPARTQNPWGKSVDELIETYRKQNLDFLVLTLLEKQKDGNWEKRRVVFLLQDLHLRSQNYMTDKRSALHLSAATTTFLSAEIFAKMGKVAVGQGILGGLLEVTSFALSSARETYVQGPKSAVETQLANLDSRTQLQLNRCVTEGQDAERTTKQMEEQQKQAMQAKFDLVKAVLLH